MKSISVGIIGTGFGGAVHAPIFQLHPGFEVKSIASVYRERTENRTWQGISYYRAGVACWDLSSWIWP
ncbi:Gfo/Idh/MocA family oxidoreductase [Paenibacillus solani]|uniref:Gfo/Idh/MocA family oxidoreductase n=1 Tax=Paenibacillus solani TaxID=1705565 RepID=UPI001F5F9A00|nr:Gfo/Idh/MocA family oxidoreductase [Paenibacillus solani]